MPILISYFEPRKNRTNFNHCFYIDTNYSCGKWHNYIVYVVHVVNILLHFRISEIILVCDQKACDPVFTANGQQTQGQFVSVFSIYIYLSIKCTLLYFTEYKYTSLSRTLITPCPWFKRNRVWSRHITITNCRSTHGMVRRAAEHLQLQDIQKTIKAKQPALSFLSRWCNTRKNIR